MDSDAVVELRLRSAEELRDARRLKVGHLLHPNHALARIAPAAGPCTPSLSDLTLTQLHPATSSTLADDDDGTLFPTWKPSAASGLRLDLGSNVHHPTYTSIVLELYALRRRSALPTRRELRLVGSVTIPLSDIVGSGDGKTSRTWQLLSYRVRCPSGRLQGVLNFSARVAHQSVHHHHASLNIMYNM